jgi:signal transduction histidine kinase
MKNKISNQFLGHFLIIFLLTIAATAFTFVLISAASGLISASLTKNRYPASSIIKEDYTQIDASQVVESGGGVQIVDKDYNVVYTAGLDTINKESFNAQEFTEFLTESKSKPFSYDILYQPEGEFWLIVTFPTSVRLDFGLTYNKDALPQDLLYAGGAFAAALLTYLLTIALISFIYSRITALKITVPLKKLTDGTRLLREGDYSARVDLNLKNEFAELQETFNGMAARIEHETALRKKAEENRRRLILDISHDIKSPLASIQGYAELLLGKSQAAELKVIHRSSIRANRLLNDLFELSKLDSPDFTLKTEKTDICEALRQICGEIVPQLESANFKYDFDIPENSVYAMLDTGNFRRIIQNLADNSVRHNSPGCSVSVKLTAEGNAAEIMFADDGAGIPEDIAGRIFEPFVRRDDGSRNSASGGSGLGLSIAKKIAVAHGGDLALCRADKGSVFKITIPVI